MKQISDLPDRETSFTFMFVQSAIPNLPDSCCKACGVNFAQLKTA